MTATATETTTTSLIAFTLPGTPYSVQMARFYIRAALNYHDLGDFTTDAVTVASELVTNAITHTGAPSIGVELMRMHHPRALAVAVVVTDTSPIPPVLRNPHHDAEQGRGLHLVAALSAGWNWSPHETGKAVYSILMRKNEPVEATSGQPMPSGIDADNRSLRCGSTAVPHPAEGNRRP